MQTDEAHSVPCAALQVIQTKVKNLEDWQGRQNGTLHDINEKLDRLLLWLIGALFAALVSGGLLVANLLSRAHP